MPGYLTKWTITAITKETLEIKNVNYCELIGTSIYIFYYNTVLKGKNDNNRTIKNFI